jgi:hypothetical protein
MLLPKPFIDLFGSKFLFSQGLKILLQLWQGQVANIWVFRFQHGAKIPHNWAIPEGAPDR